MNINSYWLVVCLAVMVGFTSCELKRQELKPVVQCKSWVPVTINNVVMNCPLSWALDVSQENGTMLRATSPADGANDTFRENVNIVMQDLTSQPIHTLDQFTEFSKSQLLTQLPNCMILSSIRVEINGQGYQQLTFTTNQNNTSLIYLQRYVVKDNKAYIVTLTCEESQFERYREIGKKMFKSFTVK